MSAPGPGSDAQKYSIFHDGAEEGLKAWHAPYAAAFGSGCVADVGCGPGYFLDLLRQRGIAGVGIDIDQAMVDAAKRRGHEAILGDHTTLATMPEAFTGVHLSHVIEHLWGDDAVALLEGAKIALRPGGMLVVRTPNWGNATVRHGGFWLDHTHKRPYPKELLEKLLTDMNFEVLQAGFEPSGWEDTFVVSRKRAISTNFMRPGAAIADPVAPPAPRAAVAPAPGVRHKIAWRGDFLEQHSFARVNRELAKAIAATGAVEIVPLGEPTQLVEEAIGVKPRHAIDTSTGLPTFTLKHAWPPLLMRPQSGYALHIQPFECGAVPQSWIDEMTKATDDVWCPSEHIRGVYIDGGMPAERTFVQPWGVDPDIFHPRVAATDIGSESVCVFLFVGGAIARKGIDLLLDAYLEEFTPRDDVALIVKAFGANSFYRNENSHGRIVELMKRTDVPIVRYSDEMFSDAALASLYRRANALVLPYQGEGFGLPVLEAMACGTPAIVTAGGATDDFVHEDTGYRMPARRVPSTLTTGDELASPGWVLDVDKATLRRSLRYAYEHQAELREKGARAATYVMQHHTWAEVARRAVAHLDELAQRPPIVRAGVYDALNDYERKISSQNGEDGIITELFSRLRVIDPFFVEFGAEAGLECNSALLARTYGWSGVMIEGGDESFARLQQNYQAYPKVRPVHGMVTRENITAIFAANGVPKTLDMLSIDVDGNDYYLWEALAEYRASVVVIEINPAYPPPQRWVMAYNPEHNWQRDDYYGASLSSLAALGDRLGYALLGVSVHGVNAFFIRRDLLEAVGFPERTPEDVFRPPLYRQVHRDGPSVAL